MKARKITALILSVMMLAGLPMAAGAAAKPETDVLPLEQFSEGLGSWSSYTPAGTTVEKATNVGTHDGCMKITTTSASGDYAAYAPFSTVATKANGFGVEYSIMIPATKSDSTANSGRPTMLLSDNIVRRNRTRLIDFSMGENRVRLPYADFTGFRLDTWYKVNVELDIITGNYRTTFTDDEGTVSRTGESNIGTTYINQFGSVGIGVISFANQAGTASEFYIDNARAYSFDYKDFNVGKVFATDAMNYATATEANGSGVWIPNTNGQYAFNISNSSETRRVNCITEPGDESGNKFMRVQSPASSYIQFKKGVSTYRYSSSDTDGVSALLYGSKIRIADTTKSNEMKLYVTSPYLIVDNGDGTTTTQGSNSEICLMTLNPQGGTVTLGYGSNAKTVAGLNMDSNKWYNLKVYHNTESGYMRAEIYDISGNTTQVFDGGLALSEGRDLGKISLYGFVNTCAEETCIDYDDLSVTAIAAGNTLKSCDFSDITLSAQEIAAGDISASVDVTSYTDAVNITTGVATLVMACYNADGAITDVDLVSVTAAEATNTATVTVPEENASSYKVKAMLWDKTCQPIADSAQLNW